ncbi:hypothetical protein LEN26_017193 [Aphanomyces euteiches]|nr:hypothetical protein LEN26_017193 [Aphanomyces euteiches]
MVSASTTIAAALLATTAYVDAHGTLFRPSLKFTGPNYAGDFYALVPMNALTPQPGDIFTNYPDANLNTVAFGRAFKASNYKSFKEFILKNQDLSKGRFSNPKTPECGFTDPNGPVVSLPDQLEWYGGQMNHPGPCEVWCDDELNIDIVIFKTVTLVVPFNTNCAATYPTGIIPYDKAKCEGKTLLTLYWMSTLLEWQVYTDCAHIGNGITPTSMPIPAIPPTTPTSTSRTPTSAPTSLSPTAPSFHSPNDIYPSDIVSTALFVRSNLIPDHFTDHSSNSNAKQQHDAETNGEGQKARSE